MLSHPFSILGNGKHLRVALFTKEDENVTDESIREFLDATGVVALKQVHGAKTVVAHCGIDRTVEADAVATDMSGLALTIRTADCQSFLVYAPSRPVVGLIHAGWRGLVAGIIPSFFDALWEEWHIRPEETTVCAGPSLCKNCSEFTDPPKELPGIGREFFSGRLVDLRRIAERQLFSLGVPEDRFERMEECTKCRNDALWSYRGSDRDLVTKGKTNFLACLLTGQ